MYSVQGMKQARREHWNLGILKVESGGDMGEIWAVAPNIGLLITPESPLKIARLQCPTLACSMPRRASMFPPKKI